MKAEDLKTSLFTVDVIDGKKKILTSKDKSFSIASGVWTRNGVRCLAMRWNGIGADDKGFPKSNGHPVWFNLPEDIREMLIMLIESSESMTVPPIN